MLKEFCGIDAPGVWDGQAGPVKGTNASNLVTGVSDLFGVDGLLRLEDSVDALRGYDGLPLKLENEGRILPVEDHDVDLIAEGSQTVYNVRRGGLISLRKIGLQQFEPNGLAGIALVPGCPKDFRARASRCWMSS